jgi:hypothetical protein
MAVSQAHSRLPKSNLELSRAAWTSREGCVKKSCDGLPEVQLHTRFANLTLSGFQWWKEWASPGLPPGLLGGIRAAH